MKPVTYRHNWDSKMSREEEMAEKFGQLLVSHDTSEDYEEETSSLFVRDGEYTWIDSNGCSCWDGDYDGWILDLEELKALAKKTYDNRYDGRDRAEELVAGWVLENL